MTSTKPPAEPIKASELGRWKLIEDFQLRLEGICASRGIRGSFSDGRRKLELGSYLGLFLFGLLNPVVRTMRALCAASDLERMQRDVCERPVSLGSFSEAQAVVDPELLKALFSQLAQELNAVKSRGHEGKFAHTQAMHWLIVDSTLWEVLPRMHWAFWRRQGPSQNAVRLHLGLHLLNDSPATAEVTEGKVCERKAWRKKWEPGAGYIGDRYFGEDYQVFQELDDLGCSFVLRLRECAVMEIVRELEVEPADARAGVIRSAWAYLGCRKKNRSMRVRLVWVDIGEEILILVTNQNGTQLSAELVAELYRRRWQVELFFRWIKCILGNRHWLAESRQGVTLQIYLALIGALLLQLHVNVRPSKRMMERIQLYLMGMATLDELAAGIDREMARIEKRAKTKNGGKD